MKSIKNQSNEAVIARLFLEGANCTSCANNYICSYAINPLDVCESYLNIEDFRRDNE